MKVLSCSGLIGSCVRMSTFFHHDAFTDNTCKLMGISERDILTKPYSSLGASVDLMGWSVIEPGMYLIAACLLTLRPVLRKVSPKDFGSRLRNTVIFRRTHNSNSDDSQVLRRKAPLPGSSVSGFVELEDRYDKRNADGGLSLPPGSVIAHTSLGHYDVEQGFAAPFKQAGTHI